MAILNQSICQKKKRNLECIPSCYRLPYNSQTRMQIELTNFVVLKITSALYMQRPLCTYMWDQTRSSVQYSPLGCRMQVLWTSTKLHIPFLKPREGGEEKPPKILSKTGTLSMWPGQLFRGFSSISQPSGSVKEELLLEDCICRLTLCMRIFPIIC